MIAPLYRIRQLITLPNSKAPTPIAPLAGAENGRGGGFLVGWNLKTAGSRQAGFKTANPENRIRFRYDPAALKIIADERHTKPKHLPSGAGRPWTKVLKSIQLEFL